MIIIEPDPRLQQLRRLDAWLSRHHGLAEFAAAPCGSQRHPILTVSPIRVREGFRRRSHLRQITVRLASRTADSRPAGRSW
jgi:hypothetical protein